MKSRARGSVAVAAAGMVLLLPALAASGNLPPVPEHDPRTGYDASIAAPHELHETYARIAIEGAVIGGRVRFFKGQIEAALGPLVGADAVDLRPGAEADVLVLRYLRDHLVLEADGVALDPVILRSGEEEMGHHTGWWVALKWEASGPVEELRIRNTLQFELFDDQRNMMRIVQFPGGTPETHYTAIGEAEVVIASAAAKSEHARVPAAPGAAFWRVP
jgi:hypothetical protein